jgi:four helix bundle protein
MENAMRPKIQSYEDLEVWQMAMTLAEQCYRLTATLPREEAYGLSAQIRRAAVSIPANIAEGYGRDQTGNFLNFLRIAQGSARELETHLLLVSRLGVADAETSSPCRQVAIRISKDAAIADPQHRGRWRRKARGNPETPTTDH